MKKNILLVSATLVGAGLLANVSLGDVAPLNAAGSKRRMSATVNTTTKIVVAPVVEKKIEATNTWVAEPAETVTTNVMKAVEEPIRPVIPVIVALTTFDCNGNGIPDGSEISAGAADWDNDQILDSCEYKIGDLNLNGVIDGADVSILLGWWGVPNPQYGDLNADGIVNALDLGILLGRFGVVTY
ncbi:MAG: Dockerin type domain [Planctomycetota bacterium]